MKDKIIATTLLCATSLFSFDYKIEPKQVNKTTWCAHGAYEAPTKQNGGYMSNSCYIKTNENSLVVIDTGSSYAQAKQTYEEMSKEYGKLPVIAVINTHPHDDHWLGNSFYKEQFNAKLIGSDAINKQIKMGKENIRIFHALSDEQIKNTKLVEIDQVINETTTLNLGNKEFTLVPIGKKAHSSDDIFIYVQSDKILFAGDIVMNGRITSNRDGSVIGTLKALEMMEEKSWDNLVPGHGHDTSKNAINETKQYFTLLKQRVLEAIENDVGVGNVTKVVTMEEFKDKAMYDMLNSRNVFDAYGELEFYEGD